MSYSEPLINQVYRFFLATGFGSIMAVVYELCSVIKSIAGNGKSVVITFDLIFSVIFTVLSFFFMLIYNEGEARLNLVVAELLGLYVFHAAFGKRMVEPVVNMSGKIWNYFKEKNRKKNKN